VLNGILRHPRLRHLDERRVLLGEENLDAQNVAVNAKERKEDVGVDARLIQVGNDENASASDALSTHPSRHTHQSHAGTTHAHHATHSAVAAITTTALRIERIVGLFSSVDWWFAQDAHSRPSGAARCDKSVIRKTCLSLTGGSVTRLHHLVGAGWESGIGEVPAPFVVVLDVELGQFGKLDLQLATSVVDVFPVENLSRVLGGVTRTVFHQSLEDVILGESDDLLDASMLLEDVGEGVHARWMSHVFDVDVQNGPARLTIIHELDEMARVGLGLGLHLLVRRVLDIDGASVELERRRQAVVVVDHVNG